MEGTDERRTKGSSCTINGRSYKRYLRVIFFSLSIGTIVGCTTVNPKYTVDPTPPKRPVLQQNLVSPCPDLPKLTKPCYNQGEVIDFLTEWISLYQKCQYKHAETVKFIQDYLHD